MLASRHEYKASLFLTYFGTKHTYWGPGWSPASKRSDNCLSNSFRYSPFHTGRRENYDTLLPFIDLFLLGIISKHQDGTVISNILVTLKRMTIWDKINNWLIDIIYVTKIFFSSVRPLQMTSDTSTLNCPARNKLLSNWNESVDHSPGLLFCTQNMGSIQ